MIKILVVDDSKTARDMIVAMLRREKDVEIIGAASDGKEAVCFLKTSMIKPDVIILDMKMPLMDGNETMEYIMSYQPTPILIVTGLNKEEVLPKAKGLGVYDVIQKPSMDSDDGLEGIGNEIIEKVKELSKGNIVI